MKYETYKKYRDKAKLTDKEVSKKTGISMQYFYGWQNNYDASAKKIKPIADFLKIPYEELLKWGLV